MTEQVEFKSLPAIVKAIDSQNPNGEFEVILSTKAVDRDGERVMPTAFDPLPAKLPIYVEHDWQLGATPVAKAVPFYDGDTLKARGVYGSTPRAQEIRALVNEGIIDSMSVGFLNAERRVVDGLKSVVSGDLFESSFTGIPINVEAAVLASKSLTPPRTIDTPRPDVKAIVGSVEALQERVRDALEDAYGEWCTWLRGVLVDEGSVVFDWSGGDGDTYQQDYTDDGAVVTLTGTAVEVDVQEVIVPDADADREHEPAPTLLSVTAKATSDAAAAPAAAADLAADDAAQVKARLRIRAAALIS